MHEAHDEENPQTYPTIPYSHQFVEQLKSEMKDEMDCLEEQLRLAEVRGERISQEREMLCDEITEVKKIAMDWMNEAIGYRESYEASLKKIKIYENHIERIKTEFKERQEQLKKEFDQLKEECAEDRDKIQQDCQVELELKQLIVEKKDFYIHQLKVQLKKLIRLTEHPRLVTMLRQRFKDADLIQSNSVDTGSKSRLNEERKRPHSANEQAHRRILSFDQTLEH